jgi:hypothetical protein
METKEESTKVYKSYSFCKSIVYAIQAITGEKTHDILGTLVSEAENVFNANEIDITKRMEGRRYWEREKAARNYIYYPGTKLYLGIYVKLDSKNSGYVNGKYIRGEFNHAKYSFKLPQSYVEMTGEEFDNIAVDGMLTNSSFDFSPPKLKRPRTPAEKKKEREEKAALAKAKREFKKATKKAKKVP